MNWWIKLIDRLFPVDPTMPRGGETYTLNEIRKMTGLDLDVIHFCGTREEKFYEITCTQQSLHAVAGVFGTTSKWHYRGEAWNELFEFHYVNPSE